MLALKICDKKREKSEQQYNFIFIVITVGEIYCSVSILLFHYVRLAERGNYSLNIKMSLMFSFQFGSL